MHPFFSFLLLLLLLHLLAISSSRGESLVMVPFEAIVRRRGAMLHVICRFTRGNRKSSARDKLTWLFLPLEEKRRGSRHPRVIFNDLRTSILRLDESTAELRIARLEADDAGLYACAANWGSDVALGNQVTLDVFVDAANTTECDGSEFRCSSGECLSFKYRCDRFDNCPDGSDEDGCQDPCFDHYECRNGRCLDKRLRCDRMRVNNCGDWSDEAGCSLGDSSSIRIETEAERDRRKAIEALDHYRLTFYVAVSCVGGVLSLFVTALCLVRVVNGKERQVVAAVAGSSSEAFQQKRKWAERMEGLEKEKFIARRRSDGGDGRRRSWIIIEEEDEEEEDEKVGIGVESSVPFLTAEFSPTGISDFPHYFDEKAKESYVTQTYDESGGDGAGVDDDASGDDIDDDVFLPPEDHSPSRTSRVDAVIP